MEPYKLVKRDWQQPLLACNGNFAAAQCQALKSAVCHSLQALIEIISKCQDPKTAWQHHSLQALVKTVSKCQALKTAGQGQSLQARVETFTKCQAPKTAWQRHSLQAMVETIAKCQALKIAWQGHSLQPLVETVSKCQALKAAWQHHSLQALDNFLAKCQALKTVWEGHFLLYLLSWSPLLVQSLSQRLGFRTRSTMQHRGLLDFVGTYVHESVAASPTILCCNVCCSVGESW